MRVYVKENDFEYDLEFDNRINIVGGKSGIGKSTLIRILDNYLYDLCTDGYSFTTVESGEYKVEVISRSSFRSTEKTDVYFRDYFINSNKNKIIFLDYSPIFFRDGFLEFVEKTGSYFVIMGRCIPEEYMIEDCGFYEMKEKDSIKIIEKIK